MVNFKYIILIIGLVSLLLERVVSTKKAKASSLDEYNLWGKIIYIAVPIISFVIVLIMSVSDDSNAFTEKRLALQKHHEDSLLLLRRWEFDTIRLKQILDSSGRLIDYSNENLMKTKENFNASKSLLNLQYQQYLVSNENLKRTKRLLYLLPDSMSYRATMEFDLSTDFRSLSRYLDSVSFLTKDFIGMINGQFISNFDNKLTFKYLNCSDSNYMKIREFCKQMMSPQIDFSQNGHSVLGFWTDNYQDIFDHNFSKDAYKIIANKEEEALKNYEFIYLVNKKKLIVKMPHMHFIPIRPLTLLDNKVGLSDIDNTLFSLMVQKPNFKTSLVKVKLFTLKINEKYILILDNCISVASDLLPKNYEQIKKGLAVFQRTFRVFKSAPDIRMLDYYENNYTREDNP